MLPIEFIAEAAQEVGETVRWYEAQSPGLGQQFLDGLEEGLKAVSENPEAWPRFRRGTRRYLIRRFPYGIVYLPGRGRIRVFAVMHLRRRPGYWLSRR